MKLFFIKMLLLYCVKSYKIEMEYILGMNVDSFMYYYTNRIPIIIHRSSNVYDKLNCGNNINIDDFYKCHKDEDRFNLVIANSDKSIKLTKYKDVWYEHFKHGFSLILNGIECLELQQLFQHTFQKHVNINMYITPPYSQALSRHNDTMDVFILQIRGSKHWFLYDEKDNINHYLLTSGSMIYIPSGINHQAKTSTEESHHITIGLELIT